MKSVCIELLENTGITSIYHDHSVHMVFNIIYTTGRALDVLVSHYTNNIIIIICIVQSSPVRSYIHCMQCAIFSITSLEVL